MQLPIFNYSVQNQKADAVDVHIDGAIVDSPTKEIMQKFWGDETSTSFKSFRDQIPAGVKTVNVFVNCTGGHCGDSLAMRDYLTDLEGKGVTVNRKGRGIIASAGTYILMGKNSEMSENSWFMIHNVAGSCFGDVNQIENQAKTLRKFNDHVVKLYAKQTGMTESAVTKLMNEETWFTAEEAKAKGFVSKVTGSASFNNSIQNNAWPFQNTAVLNSYNNSTMKKQTTTASRPKNRFSNKYEAPAAATNQKAESRTKPKNKFAGKYKAPAPK